LEDLIETDNFSNDDLIIHLIETYWLSVKKLAFTYVRDWSIAEDVTQDVFIKCHKNLDNFRKQSSYKTWLFSITINKSKDTLKSNWFKTLFLFDDVKDKVNKKEKSAEYTFLKRAEEERLSKLVLTLPLKYREVIILFYYEGLNHEEIHYLLGININTLKTRLKRGKALLKKEFERSE
jgi:RNA polymerase sigma-70 factor, ECF subfamily